MATSLYPCTAQQRQDWVREIVKNNIPLKELAALLNEEHKTRIRFLWFLTELGSVDPSRLFKALPYLFEKCETLPPVYKQCFVSYWLIVGIPPSQEPEAINLCFEWLLSPKTNVTIKSRSAWLLQQLCEKHPDLKNELSLCITELLGKYTKDFDKRLLKIQGQLTGAENPPTSAASFL